MCEKCLSGGKMNNMATVWLEVKVLEGLKASGTFQQVAKGVSGTCGSSYWYERKMKGIETSGIMVAQLRSPPKEQEVARTGKTGGGALEDITSHAKRERAMSLIAQSNVSLLVAGVQYEFSLEVEDCQIPALDCLRHPNPLHLSVAD